MPSFLLNGQIGKSIETESRLVIAKAQKEEEGGVIA
jgi:hypothetical protein